MTKRVLDKFRVVILTHADASALLERLRGLETVEIAGVMVETATAPKRTKVEKLKRSIKYDGIGATLTKPLNKLWRRNINASDAAQEIRYKQESLQRYAEENRIRMYRVANFHDQTSIETLKDLNADLGIIYGTNIIRESVFSVPRLGCINLHQGLAPYYRGGPTVFWELFNGETKIGITIHFVAAKVDTGDIVLQRALPLEYDFSRYGVEFERFLDEFRASLKQPSIDMIVDAVAQIAEGTVQPIPQDITLGKRYRLPTKREKDDLRRVLRQRMLSFNQRKTQEFTDAKRAG